MISYFISLTFKVLYFILIAYCLCTWIPIINWYREPFLTIRNIAEIIFAPFRRIIPPIGMLDVSPIVAFIVLNIIENILIRGLLMFGL